MESAGQLDELQLAAPTLVRQFAELARRQDSVDALTAPCPCDGCRFAGRCAVAQCACEAFSLFL
jgi:hypothetical protein